MKKSERLETVVKSMRAEIEMIKEFANETDSTLAQKRPKVPDVSFNEKERKELKQVGQTLLSAADKSENGDSITVTTMVSDRVGHYILQALAPHKKRAFLAEMALAYLISHLEAFIKEYMLQVLILHPQMLRSSNTLTFEEAANFTSITALRAGMAEKEVENLGYGSIDDVAQYFKKKLNISLSDFQGWEQLRETVYRRNLIVHNQGRVNEIYRKKVSYRGKSTKLSTSMEYVLTASSLMLYFLTFVHEETLIKLTKKPSRQSANKVPS